MKKIIYWVKVLVFWIKRKLGMKEPFKIVIVMDSDDNGNPLPNQEKQYCVVETETNTTIECYQNIEDAKSARDKEIKNSIKNKVNDIRNKSPNDPNNPKNNF